MRIQSKADVSRLRQKLIKLHQGSSKELGPFLIDRPMMKGTVYPLRRRCGKPTCRCARGEYHETMVLTADSDGKKRLWVISEERLEEIREQTARYRYFRQARGQLLKAWSRRGREIGQVIDAIGKARTQAL